MGAKIRRQTAFVCPWFGLTIPGGAERAVRELVFNLYRRGEDVCVLTTCAWDFYSWNNDHLPGTEVIEGVPVHRYRVNGRNVSEFDRVNRLLLEGHPISAWEERSFVDNIVCSDELLAHLWRMRHDCLFVFTPYMFGTSYWGARLAGSHAVMLPCLHDEPYLWLPRYLTMLREMARCLYYSKGEAELAATVRGTSNRDLVLGLGLDDIVLPGDDECQAFRERHRLDRPFLYLPGRKQPEKNTDRAIKYFQAYQKYRNESLQLILSGPGQVDIPDDMRGCVIDLGYLDTRDVTLAMATALAVVIPSTRESFSFTMYESWQCGTPVLVDERCAATAIAVRETEAGLLFSDNHSFCQAIDRFLAMSTSECHVFGNRGRQYVSSHHSWDMIVARFRAALEDMGQ